MEVAYSTRAGIVHYFGGIYAVQIHVGTMPLLSLINVLHVPCRSAQVIMHPMTIGLKHSPALL